MIDIETRNTDFSPLQCQLITLVGLFPVELPWPAWREILRATCGAAGPDDAALGAAFHALEAKGLLYPFYLAGVSSVHVRGMLGRNADIRRRAAAAFGPIDFAATQALVRRMCDEQPSAPFMDDRRLSWTIERELNYLSDIRDGENFARRLDAVAEESGRWPQGAGWDEDLSPCESILRKWPEPLPAPIAELRLPWNLQQAFDEGLPAGDTLTALATAMPLHPALRCGLAVRIMAPLFVWAGRGDLLALCDRAAADGKEPPGAEADEGAADAVAFAKGFFGKGRRGAAAGAVRLFEKGRIAQKTLVALNAAKFPPPRPTLERDIDGFARHPENSPALRFLLAGAHVAWSKNVLDIGAVPDGAPPLAWLGCTMSYALSSDAARRTSFPYAPRALAAAEKAASDGWVFLAAQLGGLLAQYMEVSESAQALAASAPSDEPLLWVRTEVAKPWDPAIERLDEAILSFQRAARSAVSPKAAAGEQLVADLVLSALPGAEAVNGGGDQRFCVISIRPALAHRLRGGGMSRPDKPCTWRALRKALVAHSAGLPPETVSALDAWMRREQPHYGNEAHAMDIDGPGRDALLDILLGAGADVRLRAVLGKSAVDDPEVEIRDIELVTKDEPDGSFSISIPEAAWSADRAPLFVRAELSRFVWWRLPATLRPFVDLLRGEAGRIFRVPAGGAGKARGKMLEAATAGLPVRGAVTPAGEGASLRRVAGTSRLVARLDRRDGSLRLLLRARPAADVPDLLFPPGRGKGEVVVPDARKPFVLARDMDAEAEAAAAVRAALFELADEREGENEWVAEGPERELALLEALRSAQEAASAGLDLEWRVPPDERTKVSEVSSANLEGSKSADWWFGVTGEFRLDNGARVALRDLIAALPRRIGGYLPLGERAWVRLSSELRRRLEALAAAGTLRGDGLRVSPAALPMLDAAFADGVGLEGGSASPALPALPSTLSDAAGRISAALAAEHPVPEGLAARLRPYQAEGYEWLARLSAYGLGGCLADDMGLGKTVQLLAILLARAGKGPSLVVAPASVCGNWCAEAARFAPGLHVVRAADAATLPDGLGAGDLVVASYGILTSRTGQFEGVDWNGAVLDEAQAIKNADTRRAEAVKRLRAAWRFVATGTPVENRLSDLWSIFDYLNPGLLGSLDDFRARFLDRAGRPLPALRSLVRPLVLRRLKGEVLGDLPPKTEITLAVEPDEKERAAYEALREAEVASIHEDDRGARMKILAALMRLRRFCCSPSLAIPGAGTGAKLEALEALLGDLRENGHRALVFSQFTDVLALVKPIMERNGWGYEYLDGATPQGERTRRVEAFQRGGSPFFLISLKAGGTGLNLTAASYVVLLDPWWNPAVEDQAADRAHRIGQVNPVTIYRLVVRGTVEEKVLALHGEKRALAGAVLDGTSDATLSESDLINLLR